MAAPKTGASNLLSKQTEAASAEQGLKNGLSVSQTDLVDCAGVRPRAGRGLDKLLEPGRRIDHDEALEINLRLRRAMAR